MGPGKKAASKRRKILIRIMINCLEGESLTPVIRYFHYCGGHVLSMYKGGEALFAASTT